MGLQWTAPERGESNHKNKTLEAMAEALFHSWFVDFAPVRAKMEGRHSGLPADIAKLFPNRMVGSPRGPIPEGWEVSTIGDEVDVVGGGTPSTKDDNLWDGDINWVTPKDLSTLTSPVLLQTARCISEAGLKKISSGLLPKGTVLLSSRAPIGYLAITEVPTAINQGFIAMKCNGQASNVFTWMWVKKNMDVILQNANGSTFQEISKRNFRPIKMLIPAKGVMLEFDQCARSLYDRIVKNQVQIDSLKRLRNTLLPRLVSGQLRVSSKAVNTQETR